MTQLNDLEKGMESHKKEGEACFQDFSLLTISSSE